MLKRILDNQLHLHDEGNPAWGVGGIKTESVYEKAPTNFAEELKSLTKEYVSPKLEGVKDVLRSAATQGYKEVTLATNQIDDYVIKWLEKQGLKVKSNWSGTREEGQTYYEISW